MAQRLCILIIAALFAISSTQSASGSENASSAEGSSHFAWGADFGSSIDMSSHDMSTLDLSACFGYKNRAIHMLGIGCAYKLAIDEDARMIPIFVVMRTCFTNRPSRCFMELKGGISLNSYGTRKEEHAAYGSAGIGFNLAVSKTFRSHIIAAYTYMQRKSYKESETIIYPGHLNMATLTIGISF